jgi:glyoxylase-like metal-dependent hydrolase (beta-lactamase superfamily II)
VIAGVGSGFPVRVLAPNRGPFTLEGTNTWVVGDGPTVVIDPGPDDRAHLDEVRRFAGDAAAILLTHHHPDHAPGAKWLSDALGVAVHAFDPIDGEMPLSEGEVIRAGNDQVIAIHTPGHTPDHACFLDRERRILFTGDAVLGRGTSVVDPPEGDMAVYLLSLARMQSLAPSVICPGHGPVVWEAGAKLREYVDHRAQREVEILAALAEAAPATPAQLVPAIYRGYSPELHAPAARSVLAHLIALEASGRVVSDGDHYALAPARPGESAARTT